MSSHGYQLVHDDWWAKNRGCVATAPDGGEVFHSEAIGSKATGWVAIRHLCLRHRGGRGDDHLRQQEQVSVGITGPVT